MLGILKQGATRVGEASKRSALVEVRDRRGAEGRCDCTMR